MQYTIKQKWLSLTDRYYVRDAHGDDIYFVKGRFFSIGDKLSFQDADGNEIAFISQKLLSWGPAYHVYVHGEHHVTIRKKLFTFLGARFEIDVPGPNNISVRGNFLGHHYEFSRGSVFVAEAAKRWFSFTDRYTVTVEDEADAILILICMIAIDLTCHRSQNHSSN